MTKLALFDFDGTITRSDSMIDFIRYVRGNGSYFWGLVQQSPNLLAYKTGLLANHTAKERFLQHFLGGRSREILESKATQFAAEVLPHAIRPGAQEQLDRHRQAGDRIVIVSASLDLWIRPFLEMEQLEFLSTASTFEDGRFSGRLGSPNCYGPEKVNRIQNHLDLESYDCIIAYGDSSGDREMLALADEAHYRPFRD